MKKALLALAVALTLAVPATVAFAAGGPPVDENGCTPSQTFDGTTCVDPGPPADVTLPTSPPAGNSDDDDLDEVPACDISNENGNDDVNSQNPNCTGETTTTTTTTTTTAPPVPPVVPPVVECDGSVSFGKWYGDPQVDITLTGEGTFLVRGGKQRFSGLHKVRVVLDCDETFTVTHYKVEGGKTLRVFLDGVLVATRRSPILN